MTTTSRMRDCDVVGVVHPFNLLLLLPKQRDFCWLIVVVVVVVALLTSSSGYTERVVLCLRGPTGGLTAMIVDCSGDKKGEMWRTAVAYGSPIPTIRCTFCCLLFLFLAHQLITSACRLSNKVLGFAWAGWECRSENFVDLCLARRYLVSAFLYWDTYAV